MIPIHDDAPWERPFLALQSVMDRFVQWSNRLPGTVQLVLYPFALMLSLIHIPFALTHLLISAVLNRLRPRQLPNLTLDELHEWARTMHATWVARHANLLKHNSIDVADDVALPVINALRDVTDAFDDNVVDSDQLNNLAARLVDLPLRTAPDVHTLGLCIQRHLTPDAAN